MASCLLVSVGSVDIFELPHDEFQFDCRIKKMIRTSVQWVDRIASKSHTTYFVIGKW